jgi:acetylxylan esterase
MLFKAASLLFMGYAIATPIESEILEERQSCPAIHLFGARETTAPVGYGTSATFINLIIGAHPGATSEAIVYPACGGQASCGSVSYASSAVQGVSAVANQVNAFNTKCPNTILILVGYSQVSIYLYLAA